MRPNMRGIDSMGKIAALCRLPGVLNMTNAEGIKLLLAFRESIEVVTKKQDELLTELISIRSMLLALLNGGVDIGSGLTAEELCEQVQELMNRKMMQTSSGFQEAAQQAGKVLATFTQELEQPEQPYS